MKIDSSLRDLYRVHKERSENLRDTIRPHLQSIRRSSWHFEERIKTLESFALKVESGIQKDITAPEDFYACVFVVPNAGEIKNVIDSVENKFKISHRRPLRDDLTIKESSSFQFDDLRLYLKYEPAEWERQDLRGAVFELQIKTFLQHAWSVATHDTTYKSDRVNWRRERIAFQVRALLEQAELSVENMSVLENTTTLPETTKWYRHTNRIISELEENWDAALLPSDRKRLATSVFELMQALKYQDPSRELHRLLDRGKRENGGDHNLDWSPYRSILNYFAQDRPSELSELLCSRDYKRTIFLYPEVISLLDLKLDRARNALVVPGVS